MVKRVLFLYMKYKLDNCSYDESSSILIMKGKLRVCREFENIRLFEQDVVMKNLGGKNF